jgi:undecaprenyl-diphosphatase
MWLVLTLPVVWLAARLRARGTSEFLKDAAEAALTVIVALSTSAFIQTLWYRPRPFIVFSLAPLIPHSADAAFPSDYATVSFAMAASTSLINRPAGVIAFVVAAVIAFARVYAALHWLSDVFVEGLFVGTASTMVLQALVRFRPHRTIP